MDSTRTCIAELVSVLGKKVPLLPTTPAIIGDLFACGATVDGGQVGHPERVRVETHLTDGWVLEALGKE